MLSKNRLSGAIPKFGAILAALLAIFSAPSLTAANVVSKGDLLFLNENILLATSPKGVERTKVQLVPLKKGPIDVDGFPSSGKRFIDEAYPGSTSKDGRFAFNPVNSNRPVNSNTTDDKAVLVVTSLTEGKVKHTVEVPSPGLPKGTAYNFQSDYFPFANQGDAETNLGYNARRYVAAGSGVDNKYSIFLIISAFSCKERDPEGVPYKQQLYTKYTYDANTGKLSWSGVRQSLKSSCPDESKDLIEDEKASSGRGLGAAGSTGFLIAGRRRLTGPGELAVYKLNGKKLKAVYKKPQSDTNDYFGKLTLLSGSRKSNDIKVAGVTDPSSQSDYRPLIRVFGNVGPKPLKSSQLTGFKFEPFEYVEALAADNGALYALTRKAGKNNGPLGRTNVVKITPATLTVNGGAKIPSSKKQMFTVAPQYAGSLEVVGTSL